MQSLFDMNFHVISPQIDRVTGAHHQNDGSLTTSISSQLVLKGEDDIPPNPSRSVTSGGHVKMQPVHLTKVSRRDSLDAIVQILGDDLGLTHKDFGMVPPKEGDNGYDTNDQQDGSHTGTDPKSSSDQQSNERSHQLQQQSGSRPFYPCSLLLRGRDADTCFCHCCRATVSTTGASDNQGGADAMTVWPNRKDVLCGKGGTKSYHNGFYYKLCTQYAEAYAQTKKRGLSGKKGVALKVVSAVRGSGGRFLKQGVSENGGLCWTEISVDDAIKKVSH